MENSDLLSFVNSILRRWSGEHYNSETFENYITSHPDKCLIVDIFPNTITDSCKYNQVSVFYKKWVEHDINKDYFLTQEQKYLEFIKSLWLCNKVDICYDMHFNHYFRKGITKLVPFLKRYPSTGTQFDVKDWDVLRKITTFALREAGLLILYFRECEAIAYVNDFYLLIIAKDITTLSSLYPVATMNRLFMRPVPSSSR